MLLSKAGKNFIVSGQNGIHDCRAQKAKAWQDRQTGEALGRQVSRPNQSMIGYLLRLLHRGQAMIDVLI
jgi:hypothetical protein